jgi:UDP-2,4-diacetamido-2,4,6-trideoxy-beta-L-altropyranose hydrolase
MMPFLVIRADANAQMGTGHVMRCIALAQAWQDRGGGVTFLSHCDSDQIKQRIQDEGFTFIPIEKPHPDPSDLTFVFHALSAISYQLPAASLWLALDGYHFTSHYQKEIRNSGYRLLVIDDMAHLDYYHADILLNQNIHASELKYCCNKDTIKLLGCEYVMLRKEFLKYQDWKRKIPEKAKKILVTLGGADPDNVTLKVIESLKLINDDDLEVNVVAGPSNPSLETLQSAISNTQFTINILQNVTDMPELMAWADIAISAGGTTCWEMAFMGLPNVTAILAENQQAIATELSEKEVIVNLGEYEGLSSNKIVRSLHKKMLEKQDRSKMSRLGKKLVDGMGAKRIVKSMMIGKLKLHPVQEQDCKLIWKWANDPDVRAGSFSSEFIPWEDHVRWFNSKLNDPQCFFYIAMNDNGIPIGQVRFETNQKEICISVSIDKSFRGKGYGSMIIDSVSGEFFRVYGRKVIHAYIKKSNELSKHAFLHAGFENNGTVVRYGQKASHFTL